MKIILYICFMTKMFAIKLLVEYAQKFGEEPHNDLVLYIEEDKEWSSFELQEFIVKERNQNKKGRSGTVGSNTSRRFIKL